MWFLIVVFILAALGIGGAYFVNAVWVVKDGHRALYAQGEKRGMEILSPGYHHLGLGAKVYDFDMKPTVRDVVCGSAIITYVAVPDDANVLSLWQCHDSPEETFEIIGRKIQSRVTRLQTRDHATIEREAAEAIEPKRYGLVITELFVRVIEQGKFPTDLDKLAAELRSMGWSEDRVQQRVEQERITQKE